jgi:F-type H+-transporting ATPase subunit a
VFIGLARKGLSQRVPQRSSTKIAMHLYYYIEKVCLSVIGPHGRKYMPFIMSLWIMIFASNIMGLILPHTPTADWSMNLSISLICLIYVQYEGIRSHGLLGHLRHFAGPALPFHFIISFLFGLFLFSIEIISEAMKVASLSLRLYSNIYGGHMVVDTLNGLVGDGQWPVGGFLLPIKLLSAIIQTLVFTMLTCMYLYLVTASGDHDPEAEHGHSHEGALTH